MHDIYIKISILNSLQIREWTKYVTKEGGEWALNPHNGEWQGDRLIDFSENMDVSYQKIVKLLLIKRQ